MSALEQALGQLRRIVRELDSKRAADLADCIADQAAYGGQADDYATLHPHDIPGIAYHGALLAALASVVRAHDSEEPAAPAAPAVSTLQVVRVAWAAQVHEWNRVLAHGDADDPLTAWLGELRFRLAGPEFACGPDDPFEPARQLTLDSIARHLEQRAGVEPRPGDLLPTSPDDPSPIDG